MSDYNRNFRPAWFDEFPWLEYSIAKDAAYCFPCYLFKNISDVGGDHFVGIGFRGWNKKGRFRKHEGGPSSPHFISVQKAADLMNEKQGISASLVKQSDQDLLNALKLVQVVKWRFQSMRTDDMWNKISNEVMEFCYKNNIFVPNMNDRYVKQNKRARNAPVVTILHHYKFDCLFEIIDRFVEELGSRTIGSWNYGKVDASTLLLLKIERRESSPLKTPHSRMGLEQMYIS
ncbi:unnamed protein product [Cuscuta campestris]|uniref:TTF-type domain-containing protein n=1 Tax=Cuscuta campestris TaxID=132261 RepID=A0A484M8J6_9ASTE|nr:unnamed protein product [Cuscuta campestris]